MWPSACQDGVGTLEDSKISEPNAQPACAPVNASPAALRLRAHDSGSGWVATPFLCGCFIRDSNPVYPGAFPDSCSSITAATSASLVSFGPLVAAFAVHEGAWILLQLFPYRRMVAEELPQLLVIFEVVGVVDQSEGFLLRSRAIWG